MRRMTAIAMMVLLVLAVAAPALAQGAAPERGTVSGDQSNVPPKSGGSAIQGTITGISGSVVLVEQDPASNSGDKGFFTVTDETEITRQGEDGERVPATFEDLGVGQTVEATYSGDIATSDPPQGNAGSIAIQGEDPGPSPDNTATLSFELAVEGEPPAGATFSGFVPAEGGIAVPLADPDGDGLYTGSAEVERFGPGPRPVPPGTEPVSLPVQIVQDGASVIKDFGLVKIDGDKTFEASVSFGGAGEEVSADGIIEGLEVSSYGYGTHTLTDGGAPVYALQSSSVDLDGHAGEPVTVYGALVPGYEDGLDGGPPLVEVSRVEAAPPDGETYGFQGIVTDISGPVVLVEEDPSAESGDKGYFTVTEETEISRLLGGDALAPAAFEDLMVGQLVEAAYAGDVATSYPTQGNAASIAILGEDGGVKETATLSFELTVEGTPPAGTAFFGNVQTGEGGPGISVPLTDPDGDGVYAGSTTVDRFGPGPRPVPPGTEPVFLPVRMTQGAGTVVKDFGLVKLDGDKTFEAKVSFGDDGENTMPNDPGGSDPGGGDPGVKNPGGDGDGSGSGDGRSSGGIVDRIRSLPETGGFALLVAVAGASLVGAGLIFRRVFR